MSDDENQVEVEAEEEVQELKPRRQKKIDYGKRLVQLIAEHKQIMLLHLDNVGSRQLQEVRIALRGRATFLMGKNTIIRRVMRNEIENGNEALAVMLPYIVGNVGFCFANGDLPNLRKEIIANVVPAPARSGAFAPVDVFIPPGPTPLDPGQTAFFQALNIATKISKGAIEIINQVHLVKKGERVSSSAVALLTKLGIKPFFFGIGVSHVYENGSFYEAAILDLGESEMLGKFFKAVSKVASISLAINIPTMASFPHHLQRSFRRCVALALETGVIFKEAQPFKDYLDNPDAFKAAAAPAGGDAAAAPAAAEEEDDEDDEEAGTAMGGLFGGEAEEEGY